jgi:hypothetical protein
MNAGHAKTVAPPPQGYGGQASPCPPPGARRHAINQIAVAGARFRTAVTCHRFGIGRHVALFQAPTCPRTPKKTEITLRPDEFRAQPLKVSAFGRSTLVNPGQPSSTLKTSRILPPALGRSSLKICVHSCKFASALPANRGKVLEKAVRLPIMKWSTFGPRCRVSSGAFAEGRGRGRWRERLL